MHKPVSPVAVDCVDVVLPSSLMKGFMMEEVAELVSVQEVTLVVHDEKDEVLDTQSKDINEDENQSEDMVLSSECDDMHQHSFQVYLEVLLLQIEQSRE